MLIQLAFGLIQIQRNYARQMNNLRAQAESKADFLRKVAPEAIFNLDFLYLETLMQQATAETDVVYSVIVSSDGRPLTRYLNLENSLIQAALDALDNQRDVLAVLAAVNQFSSIHQVQVPIESFDRPLGEIRLGYSTQRVRTESFEAALNSLATAFAVSLLLAALTIVLFSRQVHRPLKELGRFAQAFE
ncbi:MAG: hybrid sensor histidine kinase/response regulator, partial [Leptolyngbya sp. SIO4C1]|nr:hybrid sensor histidine kinase/response regulator [Leptolyngbya sp. SIO4C1]